MDLVSKLRVRPNNIIGVGWQVREITHAHTHRVDAVGWEFLSGVQGGYVSGFFLSLPLLVLGMALVVCVRIYFLVHT